MAERRISKLLLDPLVIIPAIAAIGLIAIAIRFALGTGLFDDLIIAAVAIAVIPYMTREFLRIRKLRALEERMPDFLRDLAEAKRSGMTLPVALDTCARSDYGPLTPYVRRLASRVSWGIPFEESLRIMAEEIRSPIIDRTVSLVMEAQRSGGEISDILLSAARDLAEYNEIERERKGRLQPYTMIIYAVYLVFLGIILALYKTLLPSLTGISGTMFSIEITPEEMKLILFHLAMIQAFFSGLVAGKIVEGSVFSGLKHSVLLLGIGWLAFSLFV